jgi:hypothetical protein
MFYFIECKYIYAYVFELSFTDNSCNLKAALATSYIQSVARAALLFKVHVNNFL